MFGTLEVESAQSISRSVLAHLKTLHETRDHMKQCSNELVQNMKLTMLIQPLS